MKSFFKKFPFRSFIHLPRFAAGFAAVGCLNAAVIISHTGSADPTTEGWTFTQTIPGNSPGGIVTYGPVAGPPAAWEIDAYLRSTTYRFTPTAPQITQASTNGWNLSMNVQLNSISVVANGVNTRIYAVAAAYETATQGWLMNVRYDATNGFYVTMGTTDVVSLSLAGLSATDYHNFELIYDPFDGKADLYVDRGTGNQRQLLNISSTGTSGINRVLFGTLATNLTHGDADYAAVSFAIIPEPSTSALLFASLGAVLFFRRRMSRA